MFSFGIGGGEEGREIERERGVNGMMNRDREIEIDKKGRLKERYKKGR